MNAFSYPVKFNGKEGGYMVLPSRKVASLSRIFFIGLSMEIVTYGLLLIGSIPVAPALLKFRDEEEKTRTA
jgi:hypothetical protein